MCLDMELFEFIFFVCFALFFDYVGLWLLSTLFKKDTLLYRPGCECKFPKQDEEVSIPEHVFLSSTKENL